MTIKRHMSKATRTVVKDGGNMSIEQPPFKLLLGLLDIRFHSHMGRQERRGLLVVSLEQVLFFMHFRGIKKILKSVLSCCIQDNLLCSELGAICHLQVAPQLPFYLQFDICFV